MTETRIIKKYPNRRLYDTAISSYITLEDVKRLVMDKVPIKVIEARSQTDITHNTLLQIIFEQEENGPPLFTTDMLQQMIRFYGDSMNKMFGKMFEQGLNFFKDQQKNWQSDLVSANNTNDPAQFMADFTQNNVNQWQQFQTMWLQNFQKWASNFEQQPTEEQTADCSSPESEQNH